MKSRWVITGLLCLALHEFGLTTGSDAESTPNTLNVPAFKSRLDKTVPELLAKHHVPGTVVVLISNGKIAERLSYGTAKAGTDTSIEAGMRFIAGSISKTYTAWGVLKLVDQGKLSLDTPLFDRVTRWRPRRSQYKLEEVTVSRVLSHTSGLTGDGMNDWPPEKKLPPIEKEFNGMAGARPIRLTYKPGTKWQYSNGGYGLLQILIEEVTGESFAAYMKREILEPLGIKTAEFNDRGGHLPNAPTAHHPFDQPTATMRLGAVASGGMLTSPEDLARFGLALVDDKNGPRGRGVLQPSTVEKMLTASPVNEAWGLGYHIRHLSPDIRLVGHTGGRVGWVAEYFVDPHRGNGFVIMTNSTNGGKVTSLIERRWEIWYRDSLVKTTPPIPTSDFIPFVGTWKGVVEVPGKKIPFQIDIVIPDDGSKVKTTYTFSNGRKSKLQVLALGPNRFDATIKEAGYLHGTVVKTDKIEGILHEGGQIPFTMRRIKR